jgi:hypothetical protein
VRDVRLTHPDLPPEQTIPGVVTDDGRVIPNLADAGWVIADDESAPNLPADPPAATEQGVTSLDFEKE